MATPLEVKPQPKEQSLQRVRYTHDAMIDVILQNPAISQNDLALHFGYTANWVSSIMNSDSFQARLAARKTEVVDPMIQRTLEQGFEALAQQSLRVVQEKLAATSNPDLAVKALELSSKALGFGARPQHIEQQNNTYVVALPPKAQDEAAWAANKGQVVDVQAKAA